MTAPHVLREQVKEVLLERILERRVRAGRAPRRDPDRAGARHEPGARCARRCASSSRLRFVESEPFRGARVRDGLARRARRDLPGPRGARGGGRARGGRARSDGDVEELERPSSRRCEKAAADGRRATRRSRATSRFHRTIVERAGNRILLDVWSRSASRPHDDHDARRTTRHRVSRRSPHSTCRSSRRSARGDPDAAAAACPEHFDGFAA